ncbi:ROK family protein [Enterococcus wangshanyuanii]|uniref:N-acetylmannosamine kinase n=1 Tax=Enterococcus wangshanyuanii TaxID=2005703 RepID=A0ABQ1NK29_9ENTE|nr:ROK family protein [Enterococcus wangshanyuanii]GGC76604.1 N-acetylmannosamine kinase [Enterococcus wangshanyuanii]
MTTRKQALLVLDIGGSAVKYGIWSNETLYHQNSFPTPRTRKSLYASVQQLCEQFSSEFSLIGIAVSCPGEPDESTGMIRGLSYVPFLHIGEFQKEFSDLLGLPVSLQNDADSAALAEMTLGIGKNHQNALFTIIGSGVGLSIVKEGKILVNSAEKIDTIEKFIADTIKMMHNSRVSPVQIGKTVSIKNFKWPNMIEGKDVFDLAEQGNAVACQEIERMYLSLAEILIFLNDAFVPEFIGLGGGVSNNPDLLPNLNKTIAEVLVSQKTKIDFYRSLLKKEQELLAPTIKICHFKKDANLIGAALHFKETHS